jgi:hypothetical protein
MGASRRLELLVIAGNPLFQGDKSLLQVPKYLYAQQSEPGLCGLELPHERRAKFAHALGQDNPLLNEQLADFIDQGGLGLDEPLPHAMQSVKALRLDLFDRHKPHGRPGHGFTAGFGIAGLVLRRLHLRFAELQSDQLHVMAMLAEVPGPGMGTPTRCHPDAEGR